MRPVATPDPIGPPLRDLAVARPDRPSAHQGEGERWFHQIVENIREVFWLTDPVRQEMIYVSPAYDALWGRSTTELYANPRSWTDAIHSDDRERVREAAKRDQASGEYDEEYRIVRPDGSVRWIRDRAFPVLDDQGRVHRIAGIAEDITAAKEAEAARVRSEEKLRLIAGNVRDLIYRFRLEAPQGFDYLSPAIGGLLGYRPEEMMKDPGLIPGLIHPSDRSLVESILRRDREPPEEITLRFLRRDGETVWMEVRNRLVRDASGRAAGVEGICRDVTERKRAEDLEIQLRQSRKMDAVGRLAGGWRTISTTC